jgi:hypothetical protein
MNPNFDESLSHLIHPDGTKIQVLLEDKSQWDEIATAQAYSNYASN